MFVCLRCGQSTGLPTCERCGYGFEMVDGVYQLTADPSANLSGNGVRYIGYDAIGEYYHGRGWTDAPCDPVEMADGRMIADLTERGVVLDLGSGGGNHAVPAALCGCTVVAGDIAQVLLKLLLRKAAANGVPSDRLLPCRMNALSVPMSDASIDGVLLNSVLHLISEPERVLSQVHRVLKPGGKLIMLVHSEGIRPEEEPALEAQNRLYGDRQADLYRRYWVILDGMGVKPTPRRQDFDQIGACKVAFASHAQSTAELPARQVVKLSDYFLYRMGGKGYSEQQGVPDPLHQQAFSRVLDEFREKYGPDFAETAHVSTVIRVACHAFTK